MGHELVMAGGLVQLDYLYINTILCGMLFWPLFLPCICLSQTHSESNLYKSEKLHIHIKAKSWNRRGCDCSLH